MINQSYKEDVDEEVDEIPLYLPFGKLTFASSSTSKYKPFAKGRVCPPGLLRLSVEGLSMTQENSVRFFAPLRMGSE